MRFTRQSLLSVFLGCLLANCTSIQATNTNIVTTAAEFGPNSLRAVVSNAMDGDWIVFGPSLAGQTIRTDSGPVVLDKSLTIDGASLSNNRVQLDGGYARRVFDVNSGVTVTLRSLILIGGGDDFAEAPGGAIYNQGNVTLDRCSMIGNFSTVGGGAIYNLATLTLTDCTLENNSSWGDGGAVANLGALTVNRCTFRNNTGGKGGAIANGGTLILNQSTLAQNSTYGATPFAAWSFESSAPSGTSSANTPSAFFSPEVGSGTAFAKHSGITTYSTPVGNGSSKASSSTNWAVGDYYQFSTATSGKADIMVFFDHTSSSTGPRDFILQYSLDESTFTTFTNYAVLGNGTAPNASWSAGTFQPAYRFAFNLAGITALNNAPAVYFRLTANSTVSAGGGTVAVGGSSRVDDFTIVDGGWGTGGAVYSTTTLVVNQSTIVSNYVSVAGAGLSILKGTAVLTNCIVAGNGPSPTPNISGAFTGSGNLTSGNPFLAPLANNGGFTQTMMPLTNSPALEAGEDAVLAGFTTDQRGTGYPRRSGGRVDIGAVEFTLYPPAVNTLPATSMSNTVATINGTVTPNLNGAVSPALSATTTWFEWGHFPNNNTNKTAPVALGSGATPVAISNNLSGFTPGMTYHCQLVASNGMGIFRGRDVEFGSPAIALNGGTALTNECHFTVNDPARAFGVPLAIAGGGAHSLALKSDGKIVAWGSSSFGQTNVPPGLSNVVAIAGGGGHTLALKSDGTVVAWGDSIGGQTNVPAGLSNVAAIAGGGYHSLALKNDGAVVAWGYNGSGQTNVPAGLSNVVAIAGGFSHSLALKRDGAVVAWGNGSSGQTNVPPDLSNVVAIAGGADHSLALKSDGKIVAWGSNSFGQTNVPANLSNVVAIAGGAVHNLALKSDGKIVAWGSGSSGKTNVPPGLSNVVAIAGGNSYSLALNSDGKVVAWGSNLDGQTNVPPGLSAFNLSVTGAVDPNTPGTYPLTYSCTNIFGGIATPVSRTVVVQDTLPPVITLLGANPLTNFANVRFIDPGAMALDACAGSVPVSTNSAVNVAVPGAYLITYAATDSYGNSTSSTRTVVVRNAVVTNLVDGEPGSLRQIIAEALPGQTITFASSLSNAVIPLTYGEIVLNKSLTIDGTKPSSISIGSNSGIPFYVVDNGSQVVNGGGRSRVFTVTNGATVQLNSLIMMRGATTGNNGGGGAGGNAFGGAMVNHATLTVSNCSLLYNEALGGSGAPGGVGFGGGIANFGDFKAWSSTFADNSGSGETGIGGAIYNGTNGAANLKNCTFTMNSVSSRPAPAYAGGGGAIFNEGNLTLNNCTVAQNSATNGYLLAGGGIFSLATLNLTNSIVCQNAASISLANVDSFAGAFNAGTNLVDQNPMLAFLGYHGGPTQTMPPLAGSPALDAGSDSVINFLATDQRGFSRLAGAHVDLGAVEGVAPPTRLVSEGAPWRYLANGSDQGTAWRAPGFNDFTWSNGVTRFGFGGDGEVTTIGNGTNGITTYYFRQSFGIPSAAGVANLFGQIQVDDGVILYLNGTEIYRRNMTNSAATLNYRSLASFTVSAADETAWWTFTVSPGALVDGLNVLAAEVHQVTTNSSDLGFNLDLVANYSGALPPVVKVSSPTNTVAWAAGGIPLLVNARDPEGTVTNVSFYVDDQYVGRATNAPFSGLWAAPSLGTHTVRAVATDETGLSAESPAATFFVVPPPAVATLVNSNSIWKFLDDGSNQGTLWRTNGFNDSAWSNGTAELGFGDNDEVTLVRSNRLNGTRITTYYFRKSFNAGNPAYYSNMVVRLKRDDGGVVHLNGLEIFRNNMTNGPGGPVLYTDLAQNATDEVSFFSTNVSPSYLRGGVNVVAVEIHQSSTTSSDLSFDLQLQAEGAPVLSAVQNGTTLTLGWQPVGIPGFVLQSAPTLLGPWSPAPSQANPQMIGVTPATPAVFWRLLVP